MDRPGLHPSPGKSSTWDCRPRTTSQMSGDGGVGYRGGGADRCPESRNASANASASSPAVSGCQKAACVSAMVRGASRRLVSFGFRMSSFPRNFRSRKRRWKNPALEASLSPTAHISSAKTTRRGMNDHPAHKTGKGREFWLLPLGQHVNDEHEPEYERTALSPLDPSSLFMCIKYNGRSNARGEGRQSSEMFVFRFENECETHGRKVTISGELTAHHSRLRKFFKNDGRARAASVADEEDEGGQALDPPPRPPLGLGGGPGTQHTERKRSCESCRNSTVERNIIAVTRDGMK